MWISFFALLCQKMKDDSDDDKKQQINYIQNLYGFNLFCQKRFDDSMQVFAKLGTGMAEPEHLPLVAASGTDVFRALADGACPSLFCSFFCFCACFVQIPVVFRARQPS